MLYWHEAKVPHLMRVCLIFIGQEGDTMTKKKRVKFAKSKKPNTSKGTCFVIMPFGEWFDDYYSGIFAPAIEAAGLTATRADDLYRPSAIVNDIWEYTKTATLILADLTGKNPNVFYELGLAHAAAKPAILVTASMDDIPFDLRALRVLEYDKNDPDWGTILKQQIATAITETLASPLTTVLPTFLNQPNRDISEHSDKEREIISLKQDVELLKREVRSVTSRPSRTEKRVDIGPGKAEELIRTLLEQGQSEDDILRIVSELGPPTHWVQRRMERIKRVSQEPLFEKGGPAQQGG
jgi:hypothetical protein